jgi:hypothetical protein
MTEDMLTRLKAIDPAILTDVVRQDQRSSSFEITEWSVQRLSDKGIMNPDGLWLFSGEGHGNYGSRVWSVVLKVFQCPEEETPLSDLWYWKRELLWAQSGLPENLPERIKAPSFYRLDETPEGAWLWMEHVESHHSAPWGLDDYAFAARQLGYWNGIFVTGKPLPAQPWLARQHYRSWLSGVNPEKDWQFSLHQKYISDDIRHRYDQLWTEREMFYNVLETLPQTFSHFDSQRRNLFIRQGENGSDELVLIDWALCGLGPVGSELCALVGMSALVLEWPPSAVVQLEAIAFANYLQGLREAGWSGEADLVRLGYVAWLAMWIGVVFPGPVAWWCSPERRLLALQQLGLAEEELYQQYLPILSYSLDCADEARKLIKKWRLL